MARHIEKSVSFLNRAFSSGRRAVFGRLLLVLLASLLFGACADSDNAKKGDPVLYGSAGGTNDGGGATGGVSLKW
jgi:hypothetical protein